MKPADVTVPWHDFMEGLDRLRIRMDKEEERELQALLDATGPQGVVNLAHFHSLVGLAEATEQQLQLTNNKHSQKNHKRDQREILAELMR